MIVAFTFELGVRVFMKDAQHCRGSRPRHFVILEQIASQCPAGVQKSYLLNGLDQPVMEMALTDEEPAYRPMSAAALEEHLRWQTEEGRAHDALVDERIARHRRSDLNPEP